jgi:cytochrome P450
MRLFPPVWILVRRAEQDDVVGGYQMRRGDFIAVSPYVTHRDARFFPEPERFEPDRFLPERQEQLPKFAYFPFSGGPRQCIGNHFAMQEAVLVMATLAQRYAIDVVEGQPLDLLPSVTLRPRHGIQARLRPLGGAA